MRTVLESTFALDLASIGFKTPEHDAVSHEAEPRIKLLSDYKDKFI